MTAPATERLVCRLHTPAANIMRVRRAKRVKAVAVHNLLRRADRMIAALDGDHVIESGARVRVMFPTPAAASGRAPLVAKGLTKTLGSLEVCNGLDVSVDRGCRVVCLGETARARQALLRRSPASRLPSGPGRTWPRSPDRLSRPGRTNLVSAATVWDQDPERGNGHRRTGSAPAPGCVDVQRTAARPTRGHPVRWGEDSAFAGGPGGLHGKRIAARRADQQPRSDVSRAGRRRAGQLSRRSSAGDPRPDGRRGIGPAASDAAAQRAPRTSGPRATGTSSNSPDARESRRPTHPSKSIRPEQD